MKKLSVIIVFLKICLCITSSAKLFQVPKAIIKVFHPKGLEVRVPAIEGVTLFAFHGKLNERMQGLEAGTWSKDILNPEDGYFIFRDRNARINIGDTIYYWTYFLHNVFGYREDDGEFLVKQYDNLNTNECFTSNQVQIKVISPTRFDVTYPSHPDIRLFAFYAQLNSRIIEATNATLSRISVHPDTAAPIVYSFTFNDVQLKVGDVIHYQITVKCGEVLNREINQTFRVNSIYSDTLMDSTASSVRDIALSSTTPENSSCYDSNQTKFEIYYPTGFQVSYPANSKLTKWGFHGNHNEPLQNFGAGKWTGDETTPRNGNFVFRDRTTDLKINDVIHYWIYYECNGQFLSDVNKMYTVTHYESSIVGQQMHSNTNNNNCFRENEVRLEVFQPRGYVFLYPAYSDIKNFTISFQINNGPILRPAYSYTNTLSNTIFSGDEDTQIMINDEIKYSVSVDCESRSYQERHVIIRVKEYGLRIFNT